MCVSLTQMPLYLSPSQSSGVDSHDYSGYRALLTGKDVDLNLRETTQLCLCGALLLWKMAAAPSIVDGVVFGTPQYLCWSPRGHLGCQKDPTATIKVLSRTVTPTHLMDPAVAPFSPPKKMLPPLTRACPPAPALPYMGEG